METKWSNKYSYSIVVTELLSFDILDICIYDLQFSFQWCLFCLHWAVGLGPSSAQQAVCQGHLWLLGSAGLPNHRPMAGWWIRICWFFPMSARQGSLCRNGEYNACKSSLFQRCVIWVNTLLWAYHGVITLSSGGCHFWSDGITKVFW